MSPYRGGVGHSEGHHGGVSEGEEPGRAEPVLQVEQDPGHLDADLDTHTHTHTHTGVWEIN